MSEQQPEKQDGGDDAPVPRLPRGKGIRLSTQSLIRIAMFATLLVAIVLMQRPCADNVSRFVTSFGPDAGAPARPPAAPAADLPAGDFVRLTPDMSEDEIRRRIGQAGGTADATAIDAGADAAPSGKPD